MKAPKREFSELAVGDTTSGLSSKDKLLKSAEELFAAKGFREVSVREIAAHAGVNSALVGYYFRGKQALFNEVYRTHAAPLAHERIKRLESITGKKQKPALEELMKAWITPWLRIGTDLDRALHVRFTANLSQDRWENTNKAFPLTTRANKIFVESLHKCLPHLSKETIQWRVHFIVGAITFGLRVPGPLLAFSKGRCNPRDLEMLFAEILPFAIAGFNAPEPDTTTHAVE
jgi:AcrR family transcriptional regulator